MTPTKDCEVCPVPPTKGLCPPHRQPRGLSHSPHNHQGPQGLSRAPPTEGPEVP